MGMGNAMTAVVTGENSGHYNPAAVALLSGRTGSASFGFLSLDRSLNTIYYSQPIDTNAGVGFNIINSGVTNIDGRDIDGAPTEAYSVSENQFSLSFALKIRKMIVGLNTKIFYYSLFEGLSSTAVGFDVGVLYPLTPQLMLAGTYKDINAKYKWDTNELYGQAGNSTTEKFPTRRSLGLSYRFEDESVLIAAEIEKSSVGPSFVRIGGEVNVHPAVTVRSGIDGWNFSDAESAHPSFGLTFRADEITGRPSVTYAYVLEPYGLFSIHVVSLSVRL